PTSSSAKALGNAAYVSTTRSPLTALTGSPGLSRVVGAAVVAGRSLSLGVVFEHAPSMLTLTAHAHRFLLIDAFIRASLRVPALPGKRWLPRKGWLPGRRDPEQGQDFHSWSLNSARRAPRRASDPIGSYSGRWRTALAPM